jgi:predicted acyltransferase
MVLVNNPGDWKRAVPAAGPCPWHGWTFTDWIFPFFLFIVGVSMTLSLGARAAAGPTSPTLLAAWRGGRR